MEEAILKAQIEQWKARWGEVYEIEVEIDDQGNKAKCYVRKPDFEILAASMKFAESDPLKSGTILLESCWLGGDEIIRQNTEAKLAAIRVISSLIKIREASIKKL